MVLLYTYTCKYDINVNHDLCGYLTKLSSKSNNEIYNSCRGTKAMGPNKHA